MSQSAVYAKLTDVLRDVFDDDELVATPQLTAADVDGWDSLSHIRLVLSVERAFGIKLAAADISGLKNVGEFADLISKRHVA
ncbi:MULTISPECIES: acyl carrier protein [Burkholderia]|uniref:Acyl carrier protein n=1 Tax=Burkholderia contaminans TaxID=488447 RepID=A0A2S5E1F3_9BURK|nr:MULTISPECIES: acyl carrier protein [Burkholderia]EKS9795031.1 acyl carrier protein [Burkholderia cepacia]EKS9801016.1 acyl carrier protein [Burkholderia cepacia]EKS9810033.1 acyl carrier protein [Burkholderia cepacia]EKS9817421.1 acyl carrier protein [Burkholderia cepacia]EKS9825434.1 acyl carrier protein [Burkholderia cepacia]